MGGERGQALGELAVAKMVPLAEVPVRVHEGNNFRPHPKSHLRSGSESQILSVRLEQGLSALPELPCQGTCSGCQLNPSTSTSRDRRAEGRFPELECSHALHQG